MFKIEQSLLIKKPNVELSLMSIIDQYYKEIHMLISNIHLTHVMMEENVGKVFPLETNKYDGSWYKNILVASNIIFDRLHMVIDPSIKYDEVFRNEKECDFKSLATVWNKINFIVKYNMSDKEWDAKVKEWNILATSRKLEELIATGVKIDQPLLATIDFDVDKYKSVPKKLDATKNFEFDNLVSVLKGEENKKQVEKLTTESTLADLVEEEKLNPVEVKKEQEIKRPQTFIINPQPEKVSPQPQAQPQLEPQLETTIEPVKSEKAPLSPVKKEMDQLLRWISSREAVIKAHKARLRLGYDPEELAKIESKLKQIASEQAFNDELIAEAKKLIPPDAKKSEMDEILRWINSKSKEISKFKKAMSGSSLVEDSKRLEKTINDVQSEIDIVNSMISEAKSYLPKDPAVKEMAALLKWAESRKSDINAHKRKIAKENNINDELKLIEKEMNIVNEKINTLSNQLVVLNKNKPVDPMKGEMDLILKWIQAKERDINKVKKELKQAIEGKSDVEKELEDITNKLSFAEQDLDILKKQQNLIESINEVDRRIEQENKLIKNQIASEPTTSDHERNKQPTVTKPRLASPLSIDEELENITKEMDIVLGKYNKINSQYEAALQKYKTEVKILQTAFEVLPRSLNKIAMSNVDKMIDHLLKEGYIKTDEEKKEEKKMVPVRN